MGWENRNGRFYFYGKERIGDRVRSVYYGMSEAAAIISRLTELRRDKQEMARADDRAAISKMRAQDDEIEKLDDLIIKLTSAALLSAGFHQHHGTWRRKRNGQTE